MTVRVPSNRVKAALCAAIVAMGLSYSAIQPSAAEPGSADAGAQAVAYHADGGLIGRPSIQRAAPSPRFYRTGQLSAEPSIGIDRAGRIYFDGYFASGNRLLAGTGDRSALVEASRVFMTQDGIHFKDISPSLGPLYAHQESGDPYLYVDPTTGRVFNVDLILYGSILSYSDDQGRTWTTTVVGMHQADHETVFAGPAPAGGAQPSGYPNVVYYCSMGGGMAANTSSVSLCSKSLDGGRTFTPTGAPAYQYDSSHCSGLYAGCDGATGRGFVAPDGSVYVPKGYNGEPTLAISRDEGASWMHVQVAHNGMNTNAQGFPDHDAAVVADRNGNVYYTWVGRNRLPYLALSRDRGLSWGPPVEIGVPGVIQADQPTMALGGVGKVAIFYMGSTNAPRQPFPDDSECTITLTIQNLGCPTSIAYQGVTWNGYMTETANALAPDPTFYGGSLNNPAKPMIVGTCGPSRCQAELDFEGIAINPLDGTPWAAFVDGCAGQSAYYGPVVASSPDGRGCSSTGVGVLGHFVGGPSLSDVTGSS